MNEEKSRFLKASVKQFTTNSGKEWFNIEISAKDFNTFPVNEKGFVRFTMRPRKEVGEYWDTHFIVENTFIPKAKEATTEEDGNPF
jgi:hypothetical protein